MDGKQLKNSILQWAIQGKLVPQNPKDEPAQKLLERIAAFRNESSLSLSKGTSSTSLRGAKATKQSKNQPSRIYCENGVWYEQIGTAAPKDISDEIPFEIPENWAWCRMGNIGSWGAGATPAKGNPAFYQNGEIPWLLTGELNNSIVSETKTKISKLALEKCSLRLCKPGDILIAMYGATIGKLAIAGIELTTNQACCACTVHYDFNKYLFYFLMASKSDLIKRGEGGAQPNISKEKLVNYLMSLPPLAEQKRIVAKLEQVLPLAEEYGAAQEQLDNLNKELPEALKKSILQEAIQGKLVPQNPKDEPTSVLLAKIRKEKEALVKQGKLKKKDLESSSIDEEEIPFEIPKTWTWCRMGDFITISTGLAYKKEDLDVRAKSYIRVLRGGNIDYGKWFLKDDDVLIAPQFVKDDLILKKGTFITPAVTSLEQMGKTALIESDQKDVVVGGFVLMLSPIYNDEIFLKYILNVFQSYYYKQYCQSITNKSGQAFYNLSRQKLLQCLIPLPPLAEQKRIVAKLEQLFKVL